jgi:hypothetical protein
LQVIPVPFDVIIERFFEMEERLSFHGFLVGIQDYAVIHLWIPCLPAGRLTKMLETILLNHAD